MRRVRHTSVPSLSPRAPRGFGYSSGPMRGTAGKASRSHMWRMTVRVTWMLVCKLHLTQSCERVLFVSEDYQELIEDIVRDGRLYASENHQEILKVYLCSSPCLFLFYLVLSSDNQTSSCAHLTASFIQTERLNVSDQFHPVCVSKHWVIVYFPLVVEFGTAGCCHWVSKCFPFMRLLGRTRSSWRLCLMS